MKNLPLWSLVAILVDAALQVSGWNNAYVAALLWGIVGVLLQFAIVQWAALPMVAKFKLSGLRALSFGSTLPLPEASRVVYDALRGTSIRSFIDRNFDTADQKLQVIASYVAGTAAPLFGREPAGAGLVPLDKTLLATGIFHAAGDEFKKHGGNESLYINLSLKRRDLPKVVHELKALSAELPNPQATG